MSILLATHTDAGTRKALNEDSALAMVAETPTGTLTLVAVADGVGGLSNGTLASADVVRALAQWFESEVSRLFTSAAPFDDHTVQKILIKNQLEELIVSRHQSLIAYGEKKGAQLGTTLTALLLMPNGRYLIGHVGDSRAYMLQTIRNKAHALTEDHTVAAMKAKNEQDRAAEPDELMGKEGRNVLVQCIGVTRQLTPDFIWGSAEEGDIFVLCSDGFSNRLTQQELFDSLTAAELVNEALLEQQLVQLSKICKSRGEGDNITVLMLKVLKVGS